MSLWRQLTHGLRVLTNRTAADEEVAEEVQHYLEQATAELVAHGASPEEARRAVRLEAGTAIAVREQVRASGWEHVVATIAADVRYAARQLRKNRAFAATTVLILALGIGATTAIFSVVNPILLAPLPYPGADRVMMVWERRDTGARMPNFATYRAVAEGSRSFDSLAAMRPWQPTRTGPAEPERLHGQRVSASYFRVLGVSPIVGRDFRPADDQFHGSNVVILGYRLWRRGFNADAAIVGRQVILDDASFTIVGVMAADFENVLAPEAEIWAPLQYNSSLPVDGKEWGHHLRTAGRLRPGVTIEQARSDLDASRSRVAGLYAPGYAGSGGPPDGFIVHSLQADMTADVRPALLAVMGAVMLVLLIACVNVTNLLLARGAQRRGEFAMRVALGASRSRLVRQLLTEVLLLAAVGGALGIAGAEYGVDALVAISPPELPRVAAIHVDRHVLGFGILVTVLIGTIIAILPALHAFGDRLRTGIHQGSSRSAGSPQRTRRTLVVAEVALALVLLVSAGLLLRSLDRLFAIPPGFDPSHLLTMQVQESGRRFATAEARHRFFDDALEAVRRLPGVETAAFTSQLPLSGDFDAYGVEFEKDNGRSGGPACRYAVSGGYFDTMRIPLRRGRLLDDHDAAAAPVAVLINESFAKREFGARDPVGQRVRVGADTGRADRPWSTIVGVVGDVKQASLAVVSEDAFYVATKQWPWPDLVLSLVVRARTDAQALAPAIRSAIWSVDKDQPVVRVATMERLVAVSESRRRFALVVFEVFALVGLLLAATGIFGLLSMTVTERTREIGVRAALGASRGDVLALVVGQGMMLTGLGIVIGLAGAAVASRGLMTLLFGISRLDPITYLGVVALLVAVSAVACGIPGWRAARVDPSITLRAE